MFNLVADMKDGFYEKMETELQGQQNTYYVGGIVAFELTERNSSYAMSLVRKHFADDISVPKFPYVKVKRLQYNLAKKKKKTKNILSIVLKSRILLI